MKANKNKVKLFSLFLLGFFIFIPSVFAAPNYSPIDVTTPVFLILSIASVIFLFAGIAARSPLLAILGGVGLLICGFLMLQGHILVPNGSIENVTGNITTITPVYDNWDGGNNELFGFFIIIAVAGLLWTLPSAYSED